jgi:hypothetical protein
MRTARSVALGLTLVLALVLNASAEEKEAKEVTLKGKVTCAKCDFASVKATGIEKPDSCETVLLVKKGKGKPQLFVFDKDSHKKYHGGICKKGKMGTVKGTVSKEDDRMVIHVTSLDLQDDE